MIDSQSNNSDSVLWRAALGAILIVIMDANLITWAISGGILTIVATTQVIMPVIRRRRLKRPFSAYFRPPEIAEAESKPRKISVPANSEVHVQVNRDIRITHREFYLIMGFEGSIDERPKILRLENMFVEKGKAKYGSPDNNENQIITNKDRYQIKGEEFRVRGNTATVGFHVKTGAPGRYEMYLRTITEGGEGRPQRPLTLVVEESDKGLKP